MIKLHLFFKSLRSEKSNLMTVTETEQHWSRGGGEEEKEEEEEGEDKKEEDKEKEKNG